MLQALQIDIGIFESGAPNKIDIKIRPDFTINANQSLTNILYTLRWEDPTITISLINVLPYNLVAYGTPVLYNGFYYQRFYSFPDAPVGVAIIPGNERIISSFSYTGSANARFELIKNTWTQANNGNPYLELQGTNRTGIIYQSIAPLGGLNLICPSNITAGNAPGLCGAWVTYNTPVSNDPSATVVQIAGLPSGSFFPVATTMNTFRATDTSNNSVTCSFTVKVNDLQAPAVPANGGSTVQCISSITAPTPPIATDNCSGTITPVFVSVVNTPNPLSCQGTRVYRYSYTDAANNVSFWTYTCQVTRSTAPAQSGGPVSTSGGTVQCLSAATAPAVLPVVEDACGNVLPAPAPAIADVPATLTCIGIRTYTYNYTDCAGLSFIWAYTYNITRTNPPFQDGTPVSNTASVQCIAQATPPAVLPVVKDACGNILSPPNPVVTDSPSPLICGGTRIYRYNYIDCAGLSFQWLYTYSISDTQPPQIFCQPNINLNANPGMPSAIVEITEPQATDNCGSVVISGVRSDGLGLSQPYPIGLTTIFWAATDVCGNPASCTQTIQVLSIDQAFITISNTSITEGSDMVFTVTLSGNAPGGFTLSYSTANHTAIAPGDYTPSTGILQFTGTNGETKTISVSTIDDALVEPTETFYANLSNLIYAGVNLTFANTQGIGTIVDNDAATLTINNISVAESEGQAIFTIALSNAVQNDFSLGYLTANGTAIAPDDYSTTNATLIFGGIHPLSRNISIAILDDQLVEPTENFFVNLINLQHNNQTITIAAGQGTGTIIDNDVATVSINYAQVTEGQIAVFTVSLTGKVQGGFRVNYTTQNNTAISPGDYTQTTGLLTFAGTEGETATISVSTVDDNLVEPIEDFYVMLSNLQWGGGNLTFTFMGGLGVITDNDVATVAINDVTVVEGIAAVFNVTLTGSVQGGFTVNFATANNTAVAPGDYLPVTGTLSFTGTGGEVKTVTVTTVDDLLVEPTETFMVNLSNLAWGGGNLSIFKSQGVGTITDNDTVVVVPGNANCDGTVNVLDVITMINYIMGQNPQPFCFNGADVNNDGVINVLDIIGTINIIMGGGKKAGISSKPADIYLYRDMIRFRSDGTLAGLQFELTGSHLQYIDLRPKLEGYQVASSVVGNTLHGIIYHMQNQPIPAGMIDLFAFNGATKLGWGEVFAVNTNYPNTEKVKVNIHGSVDSEFALKAYPNPSLGTFTTLFSLPLKSKVDIRLLDMTGREINRLTEVVYEKGEYEIPWNSNFALRPGFYILQMKATVDNAVGQHYMSEVKVVVMK